MSDYPQIKEWRAADGEGVAIDVGSSRLPFAERRRLLTAVLGAPVFVWLLARGRRSWS